MRLPTRLRARARLIIVSYGPYGTNNERVCGNSSIDGDRRGAEEFEASDLAVRIFTRIEKKYRTMEQRGERVEGRERKGNGPR